ncbi:hypothetical protein QBC42DRAFT_66462 [Cladorrhinum samala]|uniref:Secreted protein n=1 Tax=Cladorrhinum samala TaxID=585594 RepID=A0AAV9HUX7_9PEZI|nr:hypothetical protein QBC42DRAFT_66462 [Cladorrhinum samala]
MALVLFFLLLLFFFLCVVIVGRIGKGERGKNVKGTPGGGLLLLLLLMMREREKTCSRYQPPHTQYTLHNLYF